MPQQTCGERKRGRCRRRRGPQSQWGRGPIPLDRLKAGRQRTRPVLCPSRPPRSEERRVGNVTGVQTCALPILGLKWDNENPAREAEQEMARPCLSKRVVSEKEEDAEDAEAHRANGDEAQFHLIA